MKSSNSNTRIRTLLNELDISQTEFCNKTGLTKSALSNYLNGDRQPRQDQLDKIAKAFDLNPSWLMGYDVPMRNDEDKYYQIVIEQQTQRSTRHLMEYVIKYNELFKAAEGCTQEQIDSVTQMLKTFKKSNEQNNKEDSQ